MSVPYHLHEPLGTREARQAFIHPPLFFSFFLCWFCECTSTHTCKEAKRARIHLCIYSFTGSMSDPAKPKTPNKQEDNSGNTVSKNAEKKQAKQNEKDARKAARLAEEAARAAEKAALLTKYANFFGTAPLLQSTTYGSKKFSEISALTKASVGTAVTLRARVDTTRKKGKLAFMVLRDGGYSIQAMAAVAEDVQRK
ncbi:aspartyl-tRNA synthetase [Trypanosoma rangeli SC58]|uniref:Aspartyl-tRNA synthetase n=1 Tax=Trypanosoma rangeli SC58 TaxID=429131 RepID=A0A061IXC7_TRYRA|nr:aspartyl-tRNA synthetase [Trypanosoma rangeli SC58]